MVALVVPGAAEHRAGAVAREHEVRDPDREARAFDERVRDEVAGVVTLLLRRLDRRLAGAEPAAFGDELGRCRVALGAAEGERVFRRDRDERHAVKRVRPGREDRDREPDPCALRAADPVFLHGAHAFGPAVERR